MKHIALLVSVLIVINVSVSATSIVCGQSLALGTVRGQVMDINGAAIPNITVTVYNTVSKRRFTTDSSGSYKIKLPGGIYSITTLSTTWHPVTRSSFRLREGDNVTLNLYPVLRLTRVSTSVTKRGMEVTKHVSPSPKYARFPKLRVTRIVPVVQYVSRRRNAGITSFKMGILTFDDVTARADEIVFHASGKTFRLVGNVKIERGDKASAGDKAEISFNGGRFTSIW